MPKLDPRTLLKLLTRTCMTALENAVAATVERRHREVTSAHFFRALLGDAGSDVTVMLDAYGLVPRTTRKLDEVLGELPGDNSGKPIFSVALLQLVEDAWEGLSTPRSEKRVRSGVMLVQLLRDADRPGEGSMPALLRMLGGVIDARSLVKLGRARESAECQAATVPLPKPRLPRETVAHEVAPGETVLDIARRFALDAEEVANENGVGIHDPLAPGKTLQLRVLPEHVVPRGAPPAPTPGSARVDYRGATELTARSLVAMVVDLVRMVPERSRRDEESLRDNPPRYYRLKQILALLAAFDVVPGSGSPAPEIVDAVSNVTRKFLDHERGELRGETGIDYLRRFSPIELFIDGYFLVGRPPAELASVARRLRPFWPRHWPSHVEVIGGEPALTGSDLQVIWERAFRFRREAESVADHNGGVSAASGWHLCAVELTESVCRKMYGALRDLDELMADVVDPGRRVFSREELIRKFGFPDVDLFEIDNEWA